MPNNFFASPSLDKETRLNIDRDEWNGEEEQRENNQLLAIKRARDMSFVWENKNKAVISV
jgi:hypothetical protein